MAYIAGRVTLVVDINQVLPALDHVIENGPTIGAPGHTAFQDVFYVKPV